MVMHLILMLLPVLLWFDFVCCCRIKTSRAVCKLLETQLFMSCYFVVSVNLMNVALAWEYWLIVAWVVHDDAYMVIAMNVPAWVWEQMFLCMCVAVWTSDDRVSNAHTYKHKTLTLPSHTCTGIWAINQSRCFYACVLRSERVMMWAMPCQAIHVQVYGQFQANINQIGKWPKCQICIWTFILYLFCS